MPEEECFDFAYNPSAEKTAKECPLSHARPNPEAENLPQPGTGKDIDSTKAIDPKIMIDLLKAREKNRSCWMKAPASGGKICPARIFSEEGTEYFVKWEGKGSIENVSKKGFMPLEKITTEPFHPFEVEISDGGEMIEAYVIEEFEDDFVLVHWPDRKRTETLKRSKVRFLDERRADKRTQDARARKPLEELKPGSPEYVLRKEQLQNIDCWLKFKSGKKWWPARKVRDEDKLYRVKWYGTGYQDLIKKIHAKPLKPVGKPGELIPYSVEVHFDHGWSRDDAHVIEEFEHDLLLVYFSKEKRTEMFEKKKTRRCLE
eukprot:CAMPEP_0201534620 /NCGR_PEP_ID=MMETSP0161_2-20130828/56829_1 /ASSEMBLY_ACC=CAM_ASM_000251 /TAXON_ID=180227 /ORGANISM="Neoparamoeba aestuarina, Strain SoJaBio B1-5/56/2" /LENGTH=315 /DNA_ID=CAMNT_0047939367 /DNA_START=122 /DNA_END=1069 /DNA_ORIENTATION=-